MNNPTRVHRVPITEAEMANINNLAEKVFIATRQWIEMYEETSPEECFIEASPVGGVSVDINGETKLTIQHSIVIRSKGDFIRG